MSGFGSAMDDGRGNYSTLEVAVPRDSHKEVVPQHDNLPQAVSSVPEYYKADSAQTYAGVGTSQHYHDAPEYHHSAYHGAGDQTPPKGKRICGLAARTFYVVAAVVALVLVGAIIGGAVGGSQAAKNKNLNNGGPAPVDSGPSSNSTSPNRNSVLAANSRVAAINWMSNPVAHYAVFSQDKYDALMVSLFDAQNQTWTAVNISRVLARGGNPITVKRGTHLAAVVTQYPWPFQMNLYYVTPSGNIGEVYSKDETGLTWGVGDLAKQSKQVADNGQMSGYWQRCDFGCSGDIVLLYEDKQNNLILINGSDWSKTNTLMSGLDEGSAVSLVPFITQDGRNGTNAAELRLYVDQDADIAELMFVNKTWLINGFRLASNVQLTPPPQIAAATFDGFFQIMVVRRNPDGGIVGYRWDRQKWNVNQKITLSNGGPAAGKFGFIAQNADGRFYGTVDGEIHEYRWYGSDPYTFLYVGPVGILNETATAR